MTHTKHTSNIVGPIAPGDFQSPPTIVIRGMGDPHLTMLTVSDDFLGDELRGQHLTRSIEYTVEGSDHAFAFNIAFNEPEVWRAAFLLWQERDQIGLDHLRGYVNLNHGLQGMPGDVRSGLDRCGLKSFGQILEAFCWE